MVHLQAPHCPACGAPLEVPPGASRVTCEYCQRPLVVSDERVSTRRAPPPADPEAKHPPYPEPETTSWAHVSDRFELSVIEQRVPEARGEWFGGVPLAGERFALVALRVVDAQGAGVAHPLDAAVKAAQDSLAVDGDPGLAGNLALEALCARPFDHRLEAAIVLFEPQHMRVTPWTAGWNGGLVWASSEEARGVQLPARGRALERKSLRERGDHFDNGAPLFLAADDLLVLASAGFLGRGGKGYGNGERLLSEVLNAHLGEAPLRVVTLAKNAFWDDFQQNVWSRPVPAGDVRLAAVRAVPPPLLDALPSGLQLETHTSGPFDLALLRRAGDAVARRALHGEREVLVWLAPGGAPLKDGALEAATAAICQVLDRPHHGDNENPRQAGRDALAALGTPDVKLAVVQLFHQHRRVKYFRHGWKQPVALGARGWRGESMQQFDEGGEASVGDGHRLFFPGAARYDGARPTLEALAEAWPSGKASRLYEALLNHWKTKATGPALERLARAQRSDDAGDPLEGLLLVTGRP